LSPGRFIADPCPFIPSLVARGAETSHRWTTGRLALNEKSPAELCSALTFPYPDEFDS